MQFRRPGKLRIGIDIAPLVDVVFLLVIFFAASTTFLETSGLKLQLPRSTATAERQSHEIAVYLAADGEVEFDGERVDLDQLQQRVRGALEGADSKIVVLRADTATPHGKVVEVMDAIRRAGAEGLTVATRSARG
jgi:biopolymer transport protein ExbD